MFFEKEDKLLITAGIICEYNPIHNGHLHHIDRTRQGLGGDCAIVCVMSGNFVQRGDFAVFSKHARAEAAVRIGADLVVELPSPYALSSAEGFARAGVYILQKLGICDYISFGSESGDIEALATAATAMSSDQATSLTKQWLHDGVSYATARQKAADAVLGPLAEIFQTPNNLLGIEYIKAISETGGTLKPFTVKRTGDLHDSDTGCSGSALRKMLYHGELPWLYMPQEAAKIYMQEIAAGRGPVSMKQAELALLSRLRAACPADFAKLPGVSEGLEHRFLRYAMSEPTITAILEQVKTKRYAMSRLRRMLMCLCLGITADDTASPPPYIRVLAMNRTGMDLLKSARYLSSLPIITKPASVHTLSEHARTLFNKEAAATDLYTLAYTDELSRYGGQEWSTSPRIVV